MPTIMISILPDGIPVDKMQGGGADGPACPVPTQDAEVNDVNEMYAESEADYREADVDNKRCGTCGSYNQTEEILECIISKGSELTCDSDDGSLGYCQTYKFVCTAENVCNDWVKGGPITGMAEGSERDIL
jgi:hypothetical protein